MPTTVKNHPHTVKDHIGGIDQDGKTCAEFRECIYPVKLDVAANIWIVTGVQVHRPEFLVIDDPALIIEVIWVVC